MPISVAPQIDAVSPAKPNVNTPGEVAKRMEFHLRMVADLWGGTKTMREANERWLAKNPQESIEAYNNRVQKSTFYNAFRRTVKWLIGRPFSRVLTYSDQIPSQVLDLFKDIDSHGRHFDLFSKDFVEMMIRNGLGHIYVDMPPKPETEKTIADQNANGRRPYFNLVEPANIRGFRYQIGVDGKPQLTVLRLAETAVTNDPNNEWDETTIPQIRVVRRAALPGTPGTYEIWQPREEDREHPDLPAAIWEKVREGPYDLSYIPMVTSYAGIPIGVMEAEPPLLDLMWENVHHWQSRSEQTNILHYARIPLLFAKGIPELNANGERNQITFGPNSVIVCQDPAGDMKWVECKGDAIQSGAKDLEDCENRMAILGAEVLVKNMPRVTATQWAGEMDSELCDLAMMVRNGEDGLDAALHIAAEWMGLEIPADADKLVTINKDFGITMADVQDLQTLLQMRTAGQITQERFLIECQRRGLLDQNMDVDDEVAQTALERPQVDAAGNPIPPPEDIGGGGASEDTPPKTGGTNPGKGQGGK